MHRSIMLTVIVAIWAYGGIAIAQDPTLSSARITFNTPPNNDNKDHDTSVTVEVLALKGDARPTVAELRNFAGNMEFKDPSEHSFDLSVTRKIKKSEINRLMTKVSITPNGNDRWIFGYALTLSFDDGTSLDQRMEGIILDQDFRSRATATWVRAEPIDLEYTLKSARIIFNTPPDSDNKNDDTSLTVTLKAQLTEKLEILVAEKQNFAGNMEFKDPSEHSFDLDIKTPVKLKQYNLASHAITISPTGNDRWIFGYKLVVRFEGNGEPIEVIEEGEGVILDQRNRSLVVR